MRTRADRAAALIEAGTLLGDMSVAMRSREVWRWVAEEMLQKTGFPVDRVTCHNLSLAFRWLADEVEG